MAKLPTYGNGLLTFEHNGRTDTFEVVGGQYHLGKNGWNNHFSIDFPAVQHIETQRHTTKENTITEEEKAQRTLAEHAENITRKFREAERGLLEEADLKRREERDREDRNNKRRSSIKQAMNAAFDAGLYEDDLSAVLPDHCRDAFDKLREEIETNIDLDNLFEAV